MSFEDTQKELYERAARIEEMEGTIKLVYKEEQEDFKNYFLSVYKPSIILLAILLAIFVVNFIVYLIQDDMQMVGTALLIVIIIVLGGCIVLIRNIKQYKKLKAKGEMILSFNSYGLVLRGCSELAHSIYAYEWSEFDRINEDSKLLVGLSKGKAFLFPKRIFSEEEYNRFRRFSHAALGTKCFYKNFKP